MADCNMTDSLRKAVEDSFKVMATDSQGFGVKLFLEIFRQYPHLQERFSKLAGLPLEEAATSPRLKAHAVIFMGAMQNIVTAMSDPAVLTDLLEKIGVKHKEMGFHSSDFTKVMGVWDEVMLADAGVKGMPDTKLVSDAWKVVANILVRDIGKITDA